MCCRNCPYGREDFEKRMSNYNRIVEERGIPNDIYGNLQPEDAVNEFEQFLWCDKVGGKVYCFGHCTDFYEFQNAENKKEKSKQKRRNKRERNQKHKEHLKYLAENVSGYPSPVLYTDEVWIKGYGYTKNPKPYYKRVYRNHGTSKFLKRQSNKKIRRYKKGLHNGWQCHKLFDFWWELT